MTTTALCVGAHAHRRLCRPGSARKGARLAGGHVKISALNEGQDHLCEGQNCAARVVEAQNCGSTLADLEGLKQKIKKTQAWLLRP